MLLTKMLRDDAEKWGAATHTVSGLITAALELQAADEIERLRAALWKIDGLNDNPSLFNPNIDVITTAILRPVQPT